LPTQQQQASQRQVQVQALLAQDSKIPSDPRTSIKHDVSKMNEHQGQPGKEQSERGLQDHVQNANPQTDEPEIHIVFSTGCSMWQDWQSYAFFYHAMVHQPNADVTRVASGCKNETEAKSVFEQFIQPMSKRFHLHLTPGYAELVKGKSYKFFNKPYGLLHWMRHGLKLDENVQELEKVFIILDPDEFIIRPFVVDYTHETEIYADGPVLHTRVSHGKPMAQRYGFGAHFIFRTKLAELLNLTELSSSSVRAWDHEQVKNHYVAGPPYIATGRDMYAIVQLWAKIVVPLYQVQNDFLAEMYAYSAAAWHLNLPHQLLRSFMVSVPGGAGEGWDCK
jgi:peptidyl serine alpha-galactosyltransferase